MRLILTILLIGLFKADAQIVINASAPYRPSNRSLLNQFTGAAAAYSLRKLRDEYTGAAIRVRKDTTGQPEQDIFFTDRNDLDTAALKSFLNARNGFVTIWYDQSTNARNVTQATQANQPRIANLGVIDRQNGKPAIIFDGTNDFLRASTLSDWTFLHFGSANTNFGVSRFGNVTDPEAFYIIWGTTATVTSNGSYLGHDTRSSVPRDRVLLNAIASSKNALGGIVVLNIETAGSTAANTQILHYVLQKPNQVTIAERSAIASNGATVQKNNTSNFNSDSQTANHALTFGAANTNTTGTVGWYLLGSMQEQIFYNSDQSSNRTGIESNINTYYSIY